MDLPAALVLTASLWLSLPHGDTVTDLLETAIPFTFAEPMNTGGVLTGTPMVAGSDGSPWSQTTYKLQSLDVTDLTHGGFSLLYPDLALVEEAGVISGAAALDVAAPGLTIRLSARRAAASWRGEAAIAGTPAFLAAGGPTDPPPIGRLRSLGRLEGSGGGPVGAAATRLFVSAALTRSSHFGRNLPPILPGNASSGLVHATVRQGVTHDWDAVAWAQRLERPFEGRFTLANPDVRETDDLIGVIGSWQDAARWPIRLDVGGQHARLSPRGAADVAHGTLERLRDGPVQELVSHTRVTRGRIGASAVWSAPPVGGHALTFGASASRFGATAAPFGRGVIGETISGLPARAWSYAYAPSDARHEMLLDVHAADRIRLGRNVSFDVGAVVEHAAGTNGGSTGISWNSMAARAAIVYAAGPWSVLGSVRRYHRRLTLDALAYGDPSAPTGAVYRWPDPNGDGIVQPAEIGFLIARVGPGTGGRGLSSIDGALRPPRVSEGLLAIERTVGQHWTVQFGGIFRQSKDVLGVVNVGVPPDEYTVSSIFDPGRDLGGSEDDQLLPVYSRPASTFDADRYLLTNIPHVTGTYRGLHIGARTRGSDRWQVFIGGTALRTNAPAGYRGFRSTENDETILGDTFSDPNAGTFAMGRVLFDRGYGAKVAASYRGGHGISVGTVARYADGQNFARLVLVPDLPQGPDVIRAYSNGLSKFTYTLTLDARIAKSVAIVGRQATLAIDAFNALDTRNEVEENALTGPGWRAATAVQPPRVIRLSVRVRF